MRIVFSEDARDFVRRDWSDLVARDSGSSFFHLPRYLKLYWEEFGQDARLLLAFAEGHGETVGAAAFERDGVTLRFLGGTEITDYMGPVAAPGAEDLVAKELLSAVVRRDDWEHADLRGLPEDSPWLPRLSEAAAAAGLGVAIDDDGVAPLLALPASFEEYLAALPGKLRHEIRRKARRLDDTAGPRRLAFATPDSVMDDIDLFARWHRESGGPKGVFMVPGMEIFFRRLGEVFLPDGMFRLSFVETGHGKLAGAIGFRYRGTEYLYNSAFDRAWRGLAPGMVLVADLVRDAIEDGATTLDMLKGDLGYKYRFGTRPRRVRRLELSRDPSPMQRARSRGAVRRGPAPSPGRTG
jgi:CelD/BcsL family acetyltransferase involved in cellulose biosynthesis